MTRVRVFIATTEGPVAVQRITAEDPDVPSVACRDGTTEVLAISRDYARFVSRGTGLVARLTGHDAYRLDLDRPVDGGRSWQLPVLLAHLLDTEGRLAGPDESADLTLIATGEVDREQRVRTVGRLGEKLDAARQFITRHGESGLPLVVLLPEADRGPDLASRLPDGAAGAVRLLAWGRVEGLAALEEGVREAGAASDGAFPDAVSAGRTPVADGGAEALGREGAPETSPRNGALSGATLPFSHGKPDRGRRRRPRALRTGPVLLVLLLAATGTGVAAWWTGPRHWEALRHEGDYETLDRALRQAVIPSLAERYRSALQAKAPPAGSLVFGLVERRTTGGRSCADRSVRNAGHTDLTETSLSAWKPGFFRSEQGASLCEAVYRVANEGTRLIYLYFAVRPALSGRTGGAATASLRRAAALPSGASLTLELDLSRQPARPLGADVLLLAAPTPSPQLRRAFESATAGDPATESAVSLDLTALPGLGLTVKGASHAILH